MASTAITGAGYVIETDVDAYPSGTQTTPDFQNICAISSDNSITEGLDTFYKLCKNGLASNKVTSLDPAWAITVKGETDNVALNAILETKYITDRTYPFQITDNFTGEQLAFNGEITDISDTREVETVIEFTFTLKIADGDLTIT